MTTNKPILQQIFWLPLVLLLAAALAGCAGQKKSPPDPDFEKWREMAESAKGHSPSSGPRVIDLPERKPETTKVEIKVEEPERPLPTMLVTMAMRNTDVNVILRALARTANQNIMMNDNVRGVTNINVADTPWDQVFKAIMRTRGLTYKWEGDILRVMTLEDMRHDREIEKVITEQKTQVVKQKKVEPLLTRVIPINYLSFQSQKSSDSGESGGDSGEDSGGTEGGQGGSGLAKNLEKLLTRNDDGSPRGSVMLDQHTNALVVKASRDDIAELISVIEQLDRPTPLIQIEALIVETTRDAARELGIQWGGFYSGISNKISHNLTGPHKVTLDPAATTGSISNTELPAIASFPASTTNLPRSGSMTLGFLAQKSGIFVLDVQLAALEAQSKLNILSRPSITTLDNQTAVIESGTSVPFQKSSSEGGETTTEIEYKDATLNLEVTPHVIEDSMVKIKMALSKDEVDSSRNVDGNPYIITKTAYSDLILLDGETTVIGGLTKETSSGSDSGVPGLKDVPGLGNLFKGKGNSNKMEEILIFITPHILKKRALGQTGAAAGEAAPLTPTTSP